MRFKTAIFFLLFIPFSAFAEFTDAEKAEAYRYVEFERLTSQALRQLADNINTSGHINRDLKSDIFGGVNWSKRVGHEFFAALTSSVALTSLGNPLPPREDELDKARRLFDATLSTLNRNAQRAESDPDLVGVAASLREAEQILSGFDWALPYESAIHDDDPNTPWDESRTVVGPHGHLAGSKATLKRFARYHQNTLSGLYKVYRDIPNWPSDIGGNSANNSLNVQITKMANAIELSARAWAMHADVMSDADRDRIAADASLGTRGSGVEFFRALFQNELLLNANKHGAYPRMEGLDRKMVDGASRSLVLNGFGRIIRELNKVNTNAQMQVILDGPALGFLSDFSDMWQDLDGWSVLAFQFFDPLTPARPSDSEPTDDTGVTCGNGTVLNTETNQCEALPTSCPALDTDISVERPDSAAHYQCKVLSAVAP